MTSTTDISGDNSAEKYMVPALERGLRLLQEFGRDNHQLGAPELARRLQLPRATVFRMLNTLENLPSDTVVSVVCAWEDGADDTHAAEALSYTRRQAQET